jgi:hypothetical protein
MTGKYSPISTIHPTQFPLSGNAAIIFSGSYYLNKPITNMPTPPRRNIAPSAVPKAPLGAIRTIPTITPRMPAIINPILTICYQSTIINVHDDIDSILNFYIRVEWADNGEGCYLFVTMMKQQ